MKSRFRSWAAAGVGALALVLAGCGATTSSPGSSSIAPGLNNSSMQLLGGSQVEPNNWFPIAATANCSTVNGGVTGLMYMPLLWVSKTDAINTSEGIASGLTASNNDTTYTITMNPKWHWSNGTPVTAQDVVFGWDIINASVQKGAPWETCGVGIGGIGNTPPLITSVTAQGQYTVVIKTSKPIGADWFEHNALTQLIPIPKATWDKYPNNMNQELSYIENVWNKPTDPKYQVIDGPYAFNSFVNNEYWSLVANPKFDGTPKPTIKKLVFLYDTSDANIFASLKKGQFAEAGIPSAYFNERNQLKKNYLIENAPPGFCFNYMVVNQSPTQSPNGIGAAFDQQYVREAMQLGIDQPAIVKDFYNNLAVPTYDPVPSQPPNQYYDPNITKYTYNPAKGKQLLISHGWKDVNGVMTKGNLKLQFTWLVISGDTATDNIAQLIKADWAQEGIQATIKLLTFNQIIQEASTTSTQWAAAWWGGGWCYEPDYYPSGDGLLDEPTYDGGYNNATMDKLINETVNAKTPAQAKAAMDAYQVFASQNVPVLYIPSASGVEAVKPGLNGVNSSFNPITVQTWINDWRIGSPAPPIP
jgi:peptide/nickel transport system substrate-binding protein